MNHLVLIDGSGIAYRSFHAPNASGLCRKDGFPTGAIFGFSQKLWDLKRRGPLATATHAAVVFDRGGRTWRHDLAETYKANRGARPDDLKAQFPPLKKAARAFGLVAIDIEGIEADDIIATYATIAGEDRVTIITSDKDFAQLVDDRITLYDAWNKEPVDVAAVMRKYGASPRLMPHIQALTGDASDNIKGIFGVGGVKARELIARFGSLEGVLANIDKIPTPALRGNVERDQEHARLALKLVTAKRDVDVPVPIGDLAIGDFDADRLMRWCAEYELVKLAGEVKERYPNSANPLELQGA